MPLMQRSTRCVCVCVCVPLLLCCVYGVACHQADTILQRAQALEARVNREKKELQVRSGFFFSPPPPPRACCDARLVEHDVHVPSFHVGVFFFPWRHCNTPSVSRPTHRSTVCANVCQTELTELRAALETMAAESGKRTDSLQQELKLMRARWHAAEAAADDIREQSGMDTAPLIQQVSALQVCVTGSVSPSTHSLAVLTLWDGEGHVCFHVMRAS